MLFLPHISVLDGSAAKMHQPGDQMAAFSENWHFYCIDAYGVASNGVLQTGDMYTYVLPSTRLNDTEREYLFWATLSMLAGFGNQQNINTVIDKINAQAPGRGLPTIDPLVTQADLKTIIHKASTRASYPWLNAVANNAEEYMKMGGIISSTSTTGTGGGSIPTVLQGHQDLSTALMIGNSFTIDFDAGGADADFINTVPLKFSSDGSDGSFVSEPIGGWTYVKTDTHITFNNPNSAPPKLYIQFETYGTKYQVAGGAFLSVEDAYENGLQLWVCTECCGKHVNHSSTVALEAHQRLVFLELENDYKPYFAAIGTDPVPSLTGGGIEFQIYRHEEEMKSTYNLQLNKYDHETGKGSEGAIFKLYERFDDKDQVNTVRDGAVQLYEGGEPYQSYYKDNPAIWNNFRFVSSVTTDVSGHAEKTVNHAYHYDKTFCDGHPSPVFVSVPDEETDDEGDVINSDEIEAAQAENQRLAKAWVDCVAACEEYASGDFNGVHFHWIMSGVNQSEIENILSDGGSEGSTPSGGVTISASGETAYQESGCQADCEDTYDKFIALKYSYTWVEHTARDGYILHDAHPDDLPIEVITTDSSQNGANSVFAGMYSKDITINDRVAVSSATAVLAQREKIKFYQLEDAPAEDTSVEMTQETGNYLLSVVKYLFADTAPTDPDDELEEWEANGELLINDVEIYSNATTTKASSSNAAKTSRSSVEIATASNSIISGEVAFTASSSNARASSLSESISSRSGTISSTLFTDAYNKALTSSSAGKNIPPGPTGNYSHCNDVDREGNAWRIYDHRTEGELHINKRDLELQDGEGSDYDSYADTQGDNSLEGARYGLYAAADLVHPDGKTGAVYKANSLVAIGTTDKNGDLSFMAVTVSPGYIYDYKTGTLAETADGWASQAPGNLYTANTTYDDYTVDGQYERTYYNNQANNGNCWIGRPLLMGDFYVKELSRSEGYELSIGNKESRLTNNGQDVTAGLPEGTGKGYAAITKDLFPEGQISSNPTGEYGDPDYNELFFYAESKGTGADGFDILLNNLPTGAKVYRLDQGTETRTVAIGTGIYDTVPRGYYVVAENDYQYPKYNPDGSLQIREVITNYQPNQFLSAGWNYLDTANTQAAIESSEVAMTEADILAKLVTDFSITDLNFLKGKVEKALRVNGKNTPRTTSGGSVDYSSIYVGIYDAGVREGGTDYYGVSGVTPGSPASRTVYGSPVITLEIEKLDASNNPITVGDAILSVLDFYNTNSFYNYGGIHSIDEDTDKYLIAVYASQYGNPANFFVMGSDEVSDSIIYHRVEYLPDNVGESPQYVYATYSNNPDNDAFGTYENFISELIGSRYYISATLITDAVVTGTGTLISRTVTENVYYLTGETPYDAYGNPIEAVEYVERNTTTTQEVSIGQWVEIAVTDMKGKPVAHVNSSYTDAYGSSHNDTDLQSYMFRIVVLETQITLTQADIDAMGSSSGWSAGDTMGAASYYIQVKQANVKSYLSYADFTIGDTGSYVKQGTLTYPGQSYVWQDGENRPGTNTRENPIGVQQRAIKQQVKITKTIDKTSYKNTNSYSEVYEDWFTRTFGGFLGKGTEADKIANFRFKTYLKSNMVRLYRDENGKVVWQDRKGNEIDILEANKNYPGLVSKIYTKALHETDPLYQNSNDAVIHNKQLYDYAGDLINENQNSGYTAILETIEQLVEDGTGTRMVSAYNYEKFFDGIAVANNDKWEDAAPTYTSYQPIGNEANRTPYTLENARASDMVRQFAITWYLQDEIVKLIQDVQTNSQEQEAAGSVSYSDELYDEALYQAIRKAENYLKPFFDYDLDEIYAVEWDSEADGGADQDKTTLSADKKGEDYYYNTSVYLPYGVYIQVEQQPKYADLNDFANRHYQIDKQREVIVPTVYASYQGSQQIPEELSSYYNYDAAMNPEERAAKYQIRFNEESKVIKAHNHSGDFEIYPDGLSLGSIRNDAPASPGLNDYFALTQSEYRPYKNYYNEANDQSTGDVPYYLTEGQSGREGVSKHYRYSSVAEGIGIANDVPYLGAAVTKDNLYGIQYQDYVKTMQGVLTADDGKYASMLVPYTVTAPASESSEKMEVAPEASGESSCVGYAYNKFKNRLATYKLRIEKLDAETHENLLHDEAIFNIYAAKRNDAPDGDGAVLFYETDTLISGTKEFLEAMGATGINPIARRSTWIDRLTGKVYGPGNLYTGTVPAGTPICDERDQIILGDAFGNQAVAFKSYSTAVDGLMKDEGDNSTLQYQNQNVGYLETPQPLGAGTYVIVEAKNPAGYARSKPVALEIYSDEVAYYKEGNRDERVLAAVYGREADYTTTNNNKPQDVIHVARINVENAPIKLMVEKVKESSVNTAETTTDKTVTYKVSGRVDGTLTEIGNDNSLVYAYSENGVYLGYAWRKGTLEQLAARKAAGEDAELAYEGNTFAGYGYVTRTLETADDTNQYITGATMTLFDALELTASGNTQDWAYQGLVIERNRNNNVTRMYVQEGFAGEKIEFLKETDESGQEYQVTYEAGVDSSGNSIQESGNVWKAEYVQRPDTDILFYDVGELDIFTTKIVEGITVTYGYDRNHKPVPLTVLESDKVNFNKTDNDQAIYAFKGGVPYLEITGGNLKQVEYSKTNKLLEVGVGTVIYHLDRDGNRDALVDPYTGMAYATEKQSDGTEKIMVWAVNIRRDAYGNIIVRDKITTSRIATVGENLDGYSDNGSIEVTNNSSQAVEHPTYSHTESGYLTGSWKSDAGKESHKESTVSQNSSGQNMNESVLMDDNNGQFDKELNPVYNEYGLPEYYQRSQETYDKGTELYDRNGDFVRYQDSDNLDAYNQAAYRINETDELHDGAEDQENQVQGKLYHRQGEAYILENTWITSDKTPNDPFDFVMTDGQADILKRVPDGIYIMEELINPAGTSKGLPVGVTVLETAEMQHTKMVDTTTKTEIGKVDGTENYTVNRRDMDSGKVVGQATEGKGSYTYSHITGADLALYEAERVYTANGSYLKRKSGIPVAFHSTNSTVSSPELITAEWSTGTKPIYFEGLSAGEYLLEEKKTPSGYVTSRPMEIVVSNTREVQSFAMYDDHTKVEVRKYAIAGNEEIPLSNVGFTLYQAQTDNSGNVVYQDGKPQYDGQAVIDTWFADDATDYTDTIELRNYPNTNQTGQTGFMLEFEAMYKQYGTQNGTSVGWAVERSATRNSTSDTVWVLEDGTKIPIIDHVITYPAGMQQEDMDGLLAAYSANTQEANTIKWVNNRSAAYVSHTQIDSGNTMNFPTSAELLYQTKNGQYIRIFVYEGTADRQGRNFTFEYQFDYKKMDSINSQACSYLTKEGYRRFDYLPASASYVLVETTVPEGYAKAADQVITVEDIPDVQHYAIENQVTAIRISKVSGTGTKEFAGNTLALYRAAADESLVRTAEYLVTSWISGADGEYTENDYINCRIPDGYRQGDLKPHTITGLDDGVYYLVELSSVDYYTLFEAVRIDYVGQEEIRIVRVSNQAVEGELEIIKTEKTGKSLLSGAVFEVCAYLQGSRESLFTRNVSTVDGKAVLTGLPVGRLLADGRIEPYIYRVKEIIPPDEYAVNTLIEVFSFAANKNGNSYEPGEAAKFAVTVKNDKTKLYIQKRDFSQFDDSGIEGIFVAGAELAIFELQGRDEDGNPLYDADNPFTTWITEAAERHMVDGLIAGKSYILLERTAPTGYNVMKPVTFTVSLDGRKITSISNNLNLIEVSTIFIEESGIDFDNPDVDSIDSITIHGRYAIRTENVVTDQNGDEVARWIATGSGYDLYLSSQIRDGEVYTITEITYFSDGEKLVTGKITRMLDFAGAASVHLNDRIINRTNLQLHYSDGTPIYDYEPRESFETATVRNDVTPETPAVILKNRNAETGDALHPEQAVLGSIFYVNTTRHTADVEISVLVDTTMTILDTYGGVQADNKITWTVPDVKPQQAGYVSFSAEISTMSALQASVIATTNTKGLTKTTTKFVPILQPNKLIIYNELTGSGKDLFAEQSSRYVVRLFSEKGDELNGSYNYAGSRGGSLKSGDEIVLSGNEFITIDPGRIYKNIRYEVDRVADERLISARYTSGIATEADGAAVIYSRHVTDTAEREIFIKNESYLLTETTTFTGGSQLQSNKFLFALSENGGVIGIGGYDKQTSVFFDKQEKGLNYSIPGTHLQVLTADESKILLDWITDGNVYDATGLLNPGNYYILREIKPSDGYAFARDIKFYVNTDGTPEYIIMEDRKTQVFISKVDITGEKELQGGKYAIYEDDKGEIGKKVYEYFGNEDGTPQKITGILKPDKEYWLVEELPPSGYAYTEAVPFKTDQYGEPVLVTMMDKPTHIIVDKVEKNASIAIPGTHLQVLTHDKTQVVADWVTDGNSYHIIAKLNAGEQYWLHEVKPGFGYAFTPDQHFTVNLEGDNLYIMIENEKTEVVISKVDITGEKELPGGQYSIHSDDRNSIGEKIYTYEGNPDGLPQEITGLLEADKEYWLIEDLSPVGYAYSEAVKFKTDKYAKPVHVTMKDKPTHIQVKKVESGGKLLGGAILHLLDVETGEVVEIIETQENTVYEIIGKLIAGKTYRLKEIQAPSGYQMAADIIFTVSLDGVYDEVVMTDYRIRSSGGGGTIPGKPKEPEPQTEPKIGKIVPEYGGGTDGEGRIRIPFGLVRTGDDGLPFGFYLKVAGVSLIAIVVLVRRKKRDNKKK